MSDAKKTDHAEISADEVTTLNSHATSEPIKPVTTLNSHATSEPIKPVTTLGAGKTGGIATPDNSHATDEKA
ncbi:hypothetical protein ACGFYV_32070 [Streptomyces sp. NPDC048297]|uniref:hypothetical protein n=1 Tax=Streptomyces sp. NPDC048297 TaxID=3365531 RepID=UPI00372440DC